MGCWGRLPDALTSLTAGEGNGSLALTDRNKGSATHTSGVHAGRRVAPRAFVLTPVVGVRQRAALADLRVLGTGAVPRIAYELSKRVGAHGLVLGLLRRAHGRLDEGSSSELAPPLRLPRAVSTTRAQHAPLAADPFGRTITWQAAPDWHSTIENEHHWPQVLWWNIDLRSSARVADVKWAWEVGRHAHLVVGARAPAGTSENDLGVHLRSWLDRNPPEVGVHWYSNLEIALRAIAWVQILELAADRLDPSLRGEMLATLRHAGRHLLVELPYTLSSMRNNHLLGDALGMITIGELFSDSREGRALRRVGDRIFQSQLQRQVRDDGSMLEDSISYHRFSLEMLAVRALLPRAAGDLKEALARAGQFMFRLGVADGPVPQYGDWDEGRVLAVSTDKCELLGSARLALALAGTGAPRQWHDEHDEVAWYAPIGDPVPPQPAEADGHDIGGGIGRAARGDFTVWLKAGSQPSHGHADLCSTPILFRGQWAVCDPGTGTYNGPIEQRNYFRCSIAHNVLRVEGLDQLGPHRAFRWLHTARGVVGPSLAVGESMLMWGAHDAYRRLTPGRRVARTVILGTDIVVVADWVEGAPTSYALSFPLVPEAEWADGSLVMPDGTKLTLDLPAAPTSRRGEPDPYDGWWSRTYGHAAPATRLEVSGITEGPVAWTVRAGSDVAVRATDDRLTVGADEFRLEWSTAGASLHHVAGVNRTEQTAYLSLA